jgi:hypothetical protein
VTRLTLTLDASRDPLEWAALIAVPSTVAVRQTADVLSDYKGQLLYGQQAMGASKIQLLAVPFRGARTLALELEGAFAGTSTGFVRLVRMDGSETAVARLPALRVEPLPVAAIRAP